MTREITVGNVKIGGNSPLVLIAGPCVIESEAGAIRHAEKLKMIALKVGMSLIYKSSFDKANRTSISSYRGPGLKKGLKILSKIKKNFDIPVLSDVHCRKEVAEAAEVLDIIQIPAFLCRQTDLILQCAKTGRCINIKKGQFLAPWDMKQVIRKVESVRNKRILITERGTSFGYNNLISDFRSIVIMKEFGYPVVYDATHSVQMPGGLGDKSGGDRKFIPYLSMASVVCGADAVFFEVHEDPDKALSDGPNMLKLSELEKLLMCLGELQKVVR